MRPGGTPHRVEELVREGGTAVRVHRLYPEGLTESKYQDLLARDPTASGWPWQHLVRDPKVVARGKVRHPDHATIKLPTWHRVVMNTESQLPNVVFLD